MTPSDATPGRRAAAALAALLMLGAGMQMPAVRPLFAQMGLPPGAMHAFAVAGMLGAAIGAPLLVRAAERRGVVQQACAALALLSAALLLACTLPLGAPALLAVRAAEGAAHVAALSLLLGFAAGARGDDEGRGDVALAGFGMMAALAVGPAIGGALLRRAPAAPFFAAAAAAVAVVAGATILPRRAPRAEARPSIRVWGRLLADQRLAVPMALAFAERFGIGCFVVTFSLYAHHVLRLDDAHTAAGYSVMLVPFAAATYPVARAVRAARRPAVIAVGTVLYAVAIAAVGWTSDLALAAVLVVAGIASALIYGPSLCCVAAAGDGAVKASAMALYHAAGSLGMMIGLASAGVLSALLAGAAEVDRYRAVFALAGAAQIVALLAARRGLVALLHPPTAAPGEGAGLVQARR